MSIAAKAKHKSRTANGKREPTWEIASFYPLQGDWTEEDYLAFDRNAENRIVELNNGTLEIQPMPDMLHQGIVKFLFKLLDAFVMNQAIGEVYFAPLPVKLWRNQFREPDVVYLAPHRTKNKRKPPKGADLVMEVVSRGADNRNRDLKVKRSVYAKAKIPEYWIIDPESETIAVLTLSGRTYKVHGTFKPGDEATSKLLKGFKVAVRNVFAAGEGK